MRSTPTNKRSERLLTTTATTEAIEYRNSFRPRGVRSFSWMLSRRAGRVIATAPETSPPGVRCRWQRPCPPPGAPNKMVGVTAALDELIDLLDLEPLEVDLYRGFSPHEERLRVFGGQVAAQSLVAAGRTVADGRGVERPVHSLHAYF